MVQLTVEQITKNKAIFLKINEIHKVIPNELLAFLGDGFFTASASTSTTMHNACVGGLVDHILTVAKYANKINLMLPPHVQQPDINIYRVSLLSGIGKTFMFKPNENDWSIKRGQIYEYDNDLAAMRVGERSALYALNYMSLTDNEYQALINFDKEVEDSQVKWFGSPLTTILKMAVELAIMDEKKRV